MTLLFVEKNWRLWLEERGIGTYARLLVLLKKILCDALWNTADGSGSLF